jgi:hypothetical protein
MYIYSSIAVIKLLYFSEKYCIMLCKEYEVYSIKFVLLKRRENENIENSNGAGAQWIM